MSNRSKMIAGRISVRWLVLVVFLLPVSAWAVETSRLQIVTRAGTYPFSVELALTDRQRSRGLMFREQMDTDAGMLFRFDRTQPVVMWMRNTLIPLDMIFIREDGTVADIHRNAVPLSEAMIRSSEPVRYVLEVNAGLADFMRLESGDRVIHPIISGN